MENKKLEFFMQRIGLCYKNPRITLDKVLIGVSVVKALVFWIKTPNKK